MKKLCAEGTFCDTQTHSLCDNGECISREMVCDGSIDCFDHSDEKNCTEPEECPEPKHKCLNGRCIPETWICDRDKDCEDGGDENNCKSLLYFAAIR
ncbi:hypothetical protein Avbf_12008 [Armadillidium vulgare]|nr:hypothetical protein Avbf_12008 [Armadillidium vulgare]